jgi:ABC-type antimicrobial peptide transport system permease subunit
MSRLDYILKTFTHYFRQNLLVALGVVVSTTVLTGALIIGDSVRFSLEQSTFSRLGNTTHLVSVTDRYFRQEMANEMETANPAMKVTPVLQLEGMAVADGGEFRANKVQINGIRNDFSKMSGTVLFDSLQNNEIAVSKNLADKLQVKEGDNLLVRIQIASLIPMNAPFVSAEESSVSLQATVKKVVAAGELSRFNLKNSQTAHFNIFLSIERLNQLMEFTGKANQLLISTELKNDEIVAVVKNCLTPADAGLQIENIEKSGETQISTERVFLDEKIAEALQKLPGATPILTYFVNEIEKKGEEIGKEAAVGSRQSSKINLHQSTPIYTNLHQSLSIPYSFVSTISGSTLATNEIVLNRWAADDLQVKPGDSLRLEYFEIGPLRQLMVRETGFVLKEIIEMDNPLSDPTLVPHLPGLSDAGHCREWEAGVPINLDAIRDKDEKYWNDYKGTPKAFISKQKADEIWGNRFGSNTAVRFAAGAFDNDLFLKTFKSEINPGDLGMMVSPVREQGLYAARNGTDFSGLFIGLSFFLLVAGIILTSLLFRLNLENRAQQIKLFSALGFSEKQVRGFYLTEGSAVALTGGLMGLVVSVLYTSLVFKILNTLWFEIVRTDVLLIKIFPATLILGLIISLLVSMLAVFVSVRRFQNQYSGNRKKAKTARQKWGWTKPVIYLLPVVAVLIVIYQVVISGQMNPGLFFLSGILLLTGILLILREFLFSIEKSGAAEFGKRRLILLNLVRNKARSMTVITLFAIGTFLVVSTGSNKLDLSAGAQKKTSGTGGFLFFAESSVPVLFDINDKDKRADEGIVENFSAVQLMKVEGDDASCLNLNRISQPAILGVDPAALAGRFSFAVKIKETGETDPWLELNQTFADGTIPAIADQTVIQWGLGMKVGDILLYQNEKGDTLRLKLVAGTTPSVFQGFVLISNQNFLQNYPTHSGTSVFLVEGKTENQQQIGDEMNSVFRDYGWEMTTTISRLVEFYSITNTYLSIFMALGALGLILGTIGLAVILARSLLERKREIAVMQATGFDTKPIFSIIAFEYFILLVTGVLTGLVAAIIAVLPAFLSPGSDASVSTVAVVVALILVNGFIWIAGLTRAMLQKKNLVGDLRVE